MKQNQDKAQEHTVAGFSLQKSFKVLTKAMALMVSINYLFIHTINQNESVTNI